jgi:hypothetical protein
MKTARILFTIAGLAALTLATGFAAQPPSPRSERATRVSADRAHVGREQIAPNFAKRGLIGPLKAQSYRVPLHAPVQPALKKPAAGANGLWKPGRMENHHELLAQSPHNGGTAALGPGISRSRSETPAHLGGLTIASAKYSSAALDGTAFKRKP